MRARAAICTVGVVPDHPHDEHYPDGSRFLSPSGWLALDWMAAVIGFVLAEFEVHAAGGLRPLRGDAVLALLATLPVGLRRRFPLSVLVVVGAFVAALDAQAKSSWALSAMLVLAGYTAALQRQRRRSIVVCAAVAILLGVTLGTSVRGDHLATGIAGVLGLGAAWVFGDSVSVRRSFRGQLAEHEEVEQRQRAELAVRDERMRIARELHDGVRHALAVITVQAGAARRLLGRGADVGSALNSIEAQGRAAQDGLDVALGLLRDETRPVDLPPTPGLADVADLIDALRAAGTPVDLRTTGCECPLPPPIQLTVFRIVQETLTNVVKHAAGANASVAIDVLPHEVRIEVIDTGTTRSRATPHGTERTGHGIVGMRERTGAFGGSLIAGPMPGGGFRVLASIPLGRAS
jgi:signal transduction histidine kinase